VKAIKVYDQVNKVDPQKNFGISRMEDIYAKNGGKPDTPHRHDYFTILLVKQAKGEHVIDFHSFDLLGNQVYFIRPGQVHQVIEHEQSFGFSMVFSQQFLAENNISQRFIEDVSLFNNYGETPPIHLEKEQVKRLGEYCEEMMGYDKSSEKFKGQAIGAYLKLFLIYSNNLCQLSKNPQTVESGNTILRAFKALVEEHYKEWHSTSQYAEALHITPDHLNRTIKSLIGKTAKEYLQSRINTEAKRMLYFSDLSNKEVGFTLGFSEASHFSAFFKKCTGESPSAYRKKH
tara:strand:+ start:49 stop:912 length:864 start_codon:yes stop_codon:yes gene_type:complete